MLTARQNLGLFPAPDDLHSETIAHLAPQLGLVDPPIFVVEDADEKTLFRDRTAVRAFLDVVTYDERGEDLVTGAITEAASTMSDPADLINLAIEVLGKASNDLPAFSTLDRLANHIRPTVSWIIWRWAILFCKLTMSYGLTVPPQYNSRRCCAIEKVLTIKHFWSDLFL